MYQQKISRRTFLGGALALGAAAAIPARAQSQPNVLILFSDQQHWRAMGCMDPFFDTPVLDAFAADSTHFESAFCSTPQCSPSRSSLFTGRYPSKTGVMGNTGAAGGGDLMEESLGVELQAAGYYTGYFGKWHLGDNPVGNRGWDESNLKTNDKNAANQAKTFLEAAAKRDKPFALVVSMLDPHDIYQFRDHKVEDSERPIPLPESWSEENLDSKPAPQKEFMTEDQGTAIWGKARQVWEQYRDCYRTKVKLYDELAGEVLDALKAQGFYDNTLIIVTSDHGDMDAHHGLIFKGPFLYEQMVRIPLMVRLPKAFGGTAPVRITEADAVNVDVPPTIRACCGLPERPADGISLRPWLTGEKIGPSRPFVIVQYYSKQKWVNPIRMLRTHEFKYNKYIRYGEELYDLKNDPEELNNLAENPDYAALREEMAAKLDAWMEENQDPFYSFKPTARDGKAIS